jgi:hypothetical protein
MNRGCSLFAARLNRLCVRCVPRLCENYFRKMKVGNTLLIYIRIDRKVGIRMQNTVRYCALVGNNFTLVPKSGVFTQPVPVVAPDKEFVGVRFGEPKNAKDGVSRL